MIIYLSMSRKTSQVFNLVTTNMSLSENEVTKNFMVHHCFPHERSYLFGGLPWFTSFSDHHAYVSARLPPPGCRNPFSLWVKFMGLSMMRMEIEWIYEGISYFNATHHNSSSCPDLIFPTSFSHHHAPGTTVPQRAARSCSNIHREHRPAHGSWSTLSWHPSRQENYGDPRNNICRKWIWINHPTKWKVWWKLDFKYL